MKSILLGVNLDHVATLRQARGGDMPDLKEALRNAEKGGADGITIHLREDRRHIQDRDVWMVKRESLLPLNLEMSLSREIVSIALKVCPPKVCLVPERRKELTTEGGLDCIRERKRLATVVPQLRAKGIEVSLFIAPVSEQIKMAKQVGADFIELHTGCYANRIGRQRAGELKRLVSASRLAYEIGLGVNAGHGLTLENVRGMMRLPHLVELNIGHSIISRAVFIGLAQAVREMKQAIRAK